VELGITGRKAICAGASAGLGYATARALAREGAEIYLSVRREDRLTAAVAKLTEESDVPVTPIVADHSTAEGRAELLARCPEPDILVVTCSPPSIVGNYEDIQESDWQSSLATTFIALAELIRATAPGMAQRGWAESSTSAPWRPSSRLLSGAPRAALSNYTVAVSKKLARHNVVINNLLPGLFRTEGAADKLGPQSSAQAANRQVGPNGVLVGPIGGWEVPADRWGNPDEFGALCAVFCSDVVSYVIGENLSVDGGLLQAMF
jgi:3-oxoacyl-[acyl-carrier protein] reductase